VNVKDDLLFQEEMTKFHSDDYIRFLRSIRPDNMSEYNKQMQRFNVGEDCPVFDGLYEFCQLSAGMLVYFALIVSSFYPTPHQISTNKLPPLHAIHQTEGLGQY